MRDKYLKTIIESNGFEIISESDDVIKIKREEKQFTVHLRLRNIGKKESKMAHFEASALQKMIDNTSDDSIAALGMLVNFEHRGFKYQLFFITLIEDIFKLQRGGSNTFCIGEKTGRTIVKMPIRSADDYEIMNESLLYTKAISPVQI